MKVKNPEDGKWHFFVDKCLPFWVSISCSHFQRVSNAINHIFCVQNNTEANNYLDDFLQIALLQLWCNQLVERFIHLCKEISFPISMENTEWASQLIVFLGMLLDTINQTISLSIEKVEKALVQLITVMTSKKVTVLQLQKLTGLLNFISRAIVPGRAFTRRIYNKFSNPKLKQSHHVRVDRELRLDCLVWVHFLQQPEAICRPFIDMTDSVNAKQLNFYTDTAKSDKLGFSGSFDNHWMKGYWQGFIRQCNPSIEYLELYALVVAVDLWSWKFRNNRVIIFCVNESVIHMVNKTSTGCKNCMVLIRLLVLTSMKNNCRIFAKHVKGIQNCLSDALSRNNMKISGN